MCPFQNISSSNELQAKVQIARRGRTGVQIKATFPDFLIEWCKNAIQLHVSSNEG
jgi:hypothetical protein